MAYQFVLGLRNNNKTRPFLKVPVVERARKEQMLHFLAYIYLLTRNKESQVGKKESCMNWTTQFGRGTNARQVF
jgi:hypothetical protein